MTSELSQKIDLQTLEGEIKETLGDHKIMVLTTCSSNRVTARSMSCIIDGLNVFFQTDSGFLKIGQILENPRMALCHVNVQIEGNAWVEGIPARKGIEIFWSGLSDATAVLTRSTLSWREKSPWK